MGVGRKIRRPKSQNCSLQKEANGAGNKCCSKVNKEFSKKKCGVKGESGENECSRQIYLKRRVNSFWEKLRLMGNEKSFRQSFSECWERGKEG